MSLKRFFLPCPVDLYPRPVEKGSAPPIPLDPQLWPKSKCCVWKFLKACPIIHTHPRIKLWANIDFPLLRNWRWLGFSVLKLGDKAIKSQDCHQVHLGATCEKTLENYIFLKSWTAFVKWYFSEESFWKQVIVHEKRVEAIHNLRCSSSLSNLLTLLNYSANWMSPSYYVPLHCSIVEQVNIVTSLCTISTLQNETALV